MDYNINPFKLCSLPTLNLHILRTLELLLNVTKKALLSTQEQSIQHNI